MLSAKQKRFRDDFLSPLKQKLFYLKSLPMGFISGIRLVQLDEEKSVAIVPYRWRNKNPFRSMYFAVQSMAAELSTAAPALLALKAVELDTAFIIVDVKAEFMRKAQSKVSFICRDYPQFIAALDALSVSDDTATVTAKTVGVDAGGEQVSVFYFTWSFRVR